MVYRYRDPKKRIKSIKEGIKQAIEAAAAVLKEAKESKWYLYSPNLANDPAGERIACAEATAAVKNAIRKLENHEESVTTLANEWHSYWASDEPLAIEHEKFAEELKLEEWRSDQKEAIATMKATLGTLQSAADVLKTQHRNSSRASQNSARQSVAGDIQPNLNRSALLSTPVDGAFEIPQVAQDSVVTSEALQPAVVVSQRMQEVLDRYAQPPIRTTTRPISQQENHLATGRPPAPLHEGSEWDDFNCTPPGYLPSATFAAQRRQARPQPTAPNTSNVSRKKLQPLHYDGDIIKYPAWKRWFLTGFDVPQLTEEEKGQYLIGLLTGEAAKAVEGIELSEFKQMMSALDDIFDRPDLVRESLISRIRTVDANAGIRNFITSIKVLRRQLAQHEVSLDNPLVVQELEGKVPKRWSLELKRFKYGCQIRRELWNMERLLESLEAIDRFGQEGISVRVATTAETSAEADADMSPTNEETEDARVAVTAPQRTFRQTNAPRRMLPCLFCAGPHKSLECPGHQTLEQRREAIKNGKRCFKCLRRDHLANGCSKKCATCDGGHHRVICPSRTIEPAVAVAQDDEDVMISELENEIDEEADTGPVVNSCAAAAEASHPGNAPESQSFLTAAEVKIKGPSGTQLALALLDSDAEASFISQELAAKLQLQPLLTRTLRTSVVGGLSEATATLVKFDLTLNDGVDVEVKAWALPKLIGEATVRLFDGKGIRKKRVRVQAILESRLLWKVLPVPRSPADNEHDIIDSKIGPLVIPTTAAATVAVGIDPKWRPNLEDLWALETYGFESLDDQSINDNIWERFKKTTLRLPDGRYQVEWLWREGSEELPSNFELAFNRTGSLMRKLHRNLDMREAVQKIINDQLAEGVIEKVTSKTTVARLHYLPYQIVQKPGSNTTKNRLVYDGSAKSSRTALSINDAMYRGPLDIPAIHGIILRFRQGPVAVTSDIKRAFLQIGLAPHERDSVRFIVPKDWNVPFSRDNLQIMRFTRVCFGITASPALLSMTLRTHLEQQFGDTFVRDVYVDNLVRSYDSVESAIKETEAVRNSLADAKMELTQFCTNHAEVAKHLRGAEGDSEEAGVQLLGLKWQTQEDELQLLFQSESQTVLTKRRMASRLAQQFDPMGWLAPLLVAPKLMIQKQWILSKQWDVEVEDDIREEWNELERRWGGLLSLPRKIDGPSTPRLHVFVDASAAAFGAVAYLVYGDAAPHIAMAKGRISPIQPTGRKAPLMPRLELTALVLGSRLAKAIAAEIELVKPIIVWTDSSIVLHQIVKETTHSIYVENRLREIRKSRTTIEYRHVTTDENPADILSRGSPSFEALRKSQLWWEGPGWLTTQSKWPTTLVIPAVEGETPPVVAVTHSVPHYEVIWGPNFETTIEATAQRNDISLAQARATIIRQAQSETPLKVEKLKKRQNAAMNEDGLLEVPTRIRGWEQPATIYLPSHSKAAAQIADATHERLLHAGPATIFAELRRLYHLNYKVAQSAARRCSVCRVSDATPFAPLPMANLPLDRTESNSRPFQSVGVDHVGPLPCKEGDFFIVLFACAATRAIHLETTRTTSAEEFLAAFDKFESRRGLPSLVRSDNAKTFQLAAKRLSQRISPFQQFQWTFSPPLMPWAGGYWERLIKPVKRSLRRTVGRTKWPMAQLDALVVRIEGIINRRPLYRPADGLPILRPVDFLLPAGSDTPPLEESDIGDPDFTDSTETRLNTRLTRLRGQQLDKLNRFWRTFREVYLPTLADHGHQQRNRGTRRTPIIGETVLIHEDSPREDWRTAEVKEISSTGRTAIVETANGRRFQRAIQLLYPLEGEYHPEPAAGPAVEPPQTEPVEEANPSGVDLPPGPGRSRSAKIRGRNRISKWAAVLSVLMAMIAAACGQQPFVCTETAPKFLWEQPAAMKCETAPSGMTFDMRVELFEKNLWKYKTVATKCRKETVTHSLTTNPDGYHHDEKRFVEDGRVSKKECERMQYQRNCSHGTLVDHGEVMETEDFVTQDDYPGRLKSIFTANEKVTRNCFAEPITIFATHDDPHPIAAAEDMTNCIYDEEQCQINDRTIIVWKADTDRRERYRSLGVFDGRSDGKSWTDNEHQRRLIFNDDDASLAYKDDWLKVTQAGVAYRVVRRRRNREMASHLQYIEGRAIERERRLSEALCRQLEVLSAQMSELARLNPDPYLKKYFRTNAVRANWVTGRTFEITLCSPLTNLTFTPTPECETRPPVSSPHLSTAITWRINPKTLEVDDDQHVGKCGGQLRIQIEGQLYQLEHLSGQLQRLNADGPNGTVVSIGLEETIIKDWSTQENDWTAAMMAEWHKAMQSNARSQVIAKTAGRQEIAEEIRTWWPQPWWMLIAWRVVVSLVTALNLIQMARWLKAKTSFARGDQRTKAPRSDDTNYLRASIAKENATATSRKWTYFD